jgi:alpha-glucosidase/alpha-D-xyloside xylohydrolase
MQRYGAFLWSGDVFSTWETLKTHVPVAINTGLSGIPYWGTDIGGFVPTAEYTGELHVRWFQFGTFCPSFRSHGRDWHLRLPWGWNTGEIGPKELRGYTGGAADPDRASFAARVEPIVKKFLDFVAGCCHHLYVAANVDAACDARAVASIRTRRGGRAVTSFCGDVICWSPSSKGVRPTASLPSQRHLVRLLDTRAD